MRILGSTLVAIAALSVAASASAQGFNPITVIPALPPVTPVIIVSPFIFRTHVRDSKTVWYDQVAFVIRKDHGTITAAERAAASRIVIACGRPMSAHLRPHELIDTQILKICVDIGVEGAQAHGRLRQVTVQPLA